MDGPDPTPEIRAPSWAGRIRELHLLELMEKYRRRVVHQETGLPFPPTERLRPLSLERLAFETRGGLKLALTAFTPLCVAAFLLSLVWDWHGLILSCAVSGLIGFGTNWIAIKMLFYPRESRPIFGHGLIPSQRDDLVAKVATEVLENLINEELILQKIHQTRIVNRFTTAALGKFRQVTQDPEFKDDLRRMILTYVGTIARDPAFRARVAARAETSLEEIAGDRLRGFVVRRLKDLWRGPLIDLLNQEIERFPATVDEGMDGFEELAASLPKALATHHDEIDRVLTNMLVGLVHEVDLREIIYEQLDGVTPLQLEQAFLEFSDDKLSYITLLGGIFGVIGGTLIIWPIGATVVILGGVAALFLADLLAYRLLRGRWTPETPPAGPSPDAGHLPMTATTGSAPVAAPPSTGPTDPS
ncbi:MAG: DUF445 family protein [Myxococcota bacterium]